MALWTIRTEEAPPQTQEQPEPAVPERQRGLSTRQRLAIGAVAVPAAAGLIYLGTLINGGETTATTTAAPTTSEAPATTIAPGTTSGEQIHFNVGFVEYDNSSTSMRPVFEEQIDYLTPETIAATGPRPAELMTDERGLINAQEVVDGYFTALSMSIMTQDMSHVESVSSNEWASSARGSAINAWETAVENGITNVGGVKFILWGKALSIQEGNDGLPVVSAQIVSYFGTPYGNTLWIRNVDLEITRANDNVLINEVTWGDYVFERTNDSGTTPFRLWYEGDIQLPFSIEQ